MKQAILCMAAVSVLAFTACKNTDNKTSDPGHDMAAMDKDSMPSVVPNSENIKTVSVTYSNVDPKLAASMAQVTDHYLHLTNALAKDDGDEAANGSRALEKTFNNIDKSLFTSEQKKTWDELEEEMKEHAEHIGKNGDKIKHQREHFALLSEDVYSLVVAFGAGRAIYRDHCPMYNYNKGAMWLSESKEIRNPYFGSEMPQCGSIVEIIK